MAKTTGTSDTTAHHQATHDEHQPKRAACFYASKKYSDGSLKKIEGRMHRCDNGTWVGTG